MNKKGFVMIETIIVMSILSIGLIALYSSYNIILNKAVTSNNYNEPEYLYKTYMLRRFFIGDNKLNDDPSSINWYEGITRYDNKCLHISHGSSDIHIIDYSMLAAEYGYDWSYYCSFLEFYDAESILWVYNFDDSSSFNDLDGYIIDYIDVLIKQGINNAMVVKYRKPDGSVALASVEF